MSTMVPCATATGPILVESDAVFGVWAVHEQVVTGRRGRMLMHDVFTVTHVPSGMALMQDAARAPAMFMAQRLHVDCPEATLTDLLTKGSPVRVLNFAAAYIVARTSPVGPECKRVNRAPAFPLPNRRQRRTRDRFVAHPPTEKLRACGHWGRR